MGQNSGSSLLVLLFNGGTLICVKLKWILLWQCTTKLLQKDGAMNTNITHKFGFLKKQISGMVPDKGWNDDSNTLVWGWTGFILFILWEAVWGWHFQTWQNLSTHEVRARIVLLHHAPCAKMYKISLCRLNSSSLKGTMPSLSLYKQLFRRDAFLWKLKEYHQNCAWLGQWIIKDTNICHKVSPWKGKSFMAPLNII